MVAHIRMFMNISALFKNTEWTGLGDFCCLLIIFTISWTDSDAIPDFVFKFFINDRQKGNIQSFILFPVM